MQKIAESIGKRYLTKVGQFIFVWTTFAGSIKGFGPATITAILHVAHPDKIWCVWNSTSEAALVELGLYPEFARGERFGSCYVKFNSVLVDVAKSLDIDLWTLDGLWWIAATRRQAHRCRPPAATAFEAVDSVKTTVGSQQVFRVWSAIFRTFCTRIGTG